MTRLAIPKGVKDAVLREYSHLCAVCGTTDPHLHHIDEDNANNEPKNLLPLCPTHHLRDQHNPTRRIEIPKLQLFRKYKDPFILLPQFHPIYVRQQFLDELTENHAEVEAIIRAGDELTSFVLARSMGAFYGQKIKTLIGQMSWSAFMPIDGEASPEHVRVQSQERRRYRAALIANHDGIKAQLVELLRYQSWSASARP